MSEFDKKSEMLADNVVPVEDEQQLDPVSVLRETIDQLNSLPCCWDEFLGEELAAKVRKVLG